MPMPVRSPTYPLINGHKYSWSSIEAVFGALPILGIKSINYKSSLKAGTVRGTLPQKIGRTRGEQDADCDFEMYKLEAMAFISTLGANGYGFGEVSFPITVSYSELASLPPQPPVTDMIVGVRIEEIAHSNAEGTDPTTVKFTCSCMDVLHNGVSIVSAGAKFGISI